MPDGIDKGGLDYTINILGDGEEKIKRFEDALARLKASEKTTTAAASGRGKATATAEAKAKDKITVALNKQSVIEKKILALKKKQIVATSKEVQAQKVVTDKLDYITNTKDLQTKVFTKEGDIIISQMGTVGNCGVVSKEQEK